MIKQWYQVVNGNTKALGYLLKTELLNGLDLSVIPNGSQPGSHIPEQFRSYKSRELHVHFTSGWVQDLQVLKAARVF